MGYSQERRRDKRVRFSWPLWFGYDENGRLFQGQLVDLSRSGVSFTVNSDNCPGLGQHVLTRFSFPHNMTEQFEMGNYFHWSEVVRVDSAGPGRCRVAMRLHKRLAHEPIGHVAPTSEHIPALTCGV